MSSIFESTGASSDPPSLLQAGLSVLKLNKWKLPQSRYLWLDRGSLELRWSKTSKLSAVTFKRLPLGEVKKVSKLSKYRQMKAEHGFTLDAASKSFVFRTETLEIRDKIVSSLMSLLRRPIPESQRSTGPATEDTENCTTPERKTESSVVLNDFNRHEGLICSRELFSKTGSAHRKARYQEGAYKVLLTRITSALSDHIPDPLPQSPIFDSLPATVTHILEQQNAEIQRLTDELQREAAESAKIAAMRKKLKSLEAAQEKCAIVEQENEEIRGKIESQSELNRKLEQEIAELHPVNYVWTQWTEESMIEAHLDLLRKGFYAYLRYACEESVGKQLELSPGSDRRSELKERFVFCSQDLSQLIWRPVSPFAGKRVFVNTSEITEVGRGSEEDEELPGYRYLSIVSPQVTLTLAVESHSSFYLEAIRAMVARSNSLPYTLSIRDDNLLARYKVLCEQYESQARHMEHQVKRYKGSLTEHIFDLDNGLTAQQAVYNTEIEQLIEMNDRCMLTALSPECETYLKLERGAILEQLRRLNEEIAAAVGRKRGSS